MIDPYTSTVLPLDEEGVAALRRAVRWLSRPPRADRMFTAQRE
jgi:hypothetical protein